MDRYFDENHLMIRDMVRDFARTEIAPVASALDQSGEFPWSNVRKMADLGLLGIPWDEALGGAGMDTISYTIAIHELARVDASHAITVSAHTTLGTSPIVAYVISQSTDRPRVAHSSWYASSNSGTTSSHSSTKLGRLTGMGRAFLSTFSGRWKSGS